ncbi:glycosyl transferase [Alteromonas halophila]|uniref:Glycosyl transferase n=1 Tax=Alteromonas halophila TaxID=516698 RepID=A0A918JGW8_9ALTE|nr:glycosyl transferase [Alteromonas halophila]
MVIGYVWPEPDSSAAGQNMLALLTLLKQNGCQVTFMTAASDSVHKADLAARDIHTEEIALNCSSFNQQLAHCQPDIVVFDRYMSEEQFSWRVRETCPNAVRVLNTEDLHSVRQARYEAVKAGKPACQADHNTPLLHRELAAILRSDLTLVVSDAEEKRLTQTYAVPPEQICTHPLPLPAGCSAAADWAQRRDFVCIGNFRHAPNWDAVVQLKQHIWPALRRQVPDAKLRICGAYPPKKATQLHAPEQGFIVEGWVDDAASVLASARVLLAPLRFGAGVKGKLLLAMATHTPSVTSAIGAEGLGDSTRWPGAIAETHAEFTEQAARLYNQQHDWYNAVDKSADCLAAYRKDDADSQLFSRLKRLIAQPQAHRSRLFLQGMLWHHTLTSNRYMTQWIEAKNQVASAQTET